MLQLSTIIKSQLRSDEKIFITKQSKLNSTDNEWWKFEEFATRENLFDNYDKKEKVKRYWHEEGLCIILNK